MEEQTFRVAGPDGRVLGVTALFAACLLWWGGGVILALASGVAPQGTDLAITALVAVLMLYRLGLAVRGYRLARQPDGSPILWIDRVLPIGSRGVPLARLQAVRAVPDLPPILNNGILSMGGLFGWAGPAMVRDLGNVDAYGTNNRKAVLLQFSAKPGQEPKVAGKKGPIYIVTPADPPAFMAALSAVPGQRPAPGVFQVAELPVAPAPTAPAPAPRRRKR